MKKLLDYDGLSYFLSKLKKKFLLFPATEVLNGFLKLTSSGVIWANLTGVFKFKGTVTSVSELPATGNESGDVYLVSGTGEEYVWVVPSGESGRWECLGPLLTDYLVKSDLSSAAPLMDGVATSGTTLKIAREDHVHPTDTSRQQAFTDGTATVATVSSEIVTLKAGVNQTGGKISNSSSGDITLAKVAKTGAYSDLSNTPSLATVATSGSYSDLSNKPSIPSAQVNSDWNSTSGLSKILNKPNLATVATSGNYYHLSNRPDIPTAKLSDWTQTDSSLIDYIKHKPADVPIGTIVMWGGSEDSVPDGWLLCDGSFIFVKRELWNASYTGNAHLKWSRDTHITSEYTSDYGQLFLKLGGTNLLNTTSSDFINSKGFSTLLMDVNPSTDTLYFTINGTKYLMSVSNNVCTEASASGTLCAPYMKKLKMTDKFNTTVSDLEDANIVHAGTASSNGACWYGVMVYGDLSVEGGSSIGPAQYIEVYMKVPDMRLRFPIGALNSSIATGSDTTLSTQLFASGGASEVKLTSDESALPKHTHPLTVKTVLFIGGTGGSTALTDHSEGASGTSIYGSDDDTHFPRMANTELSQANKAHNNTPPYLALNFIIKYK